MRYSSLHIIPMIKSHVTGKHNFSLSFILSAVN